MQRQYSGGWVWPPKRYATSVVDSRDDLLWHNAVADLNMELKAAAEPCNCSCGQHGCVATKGAWK
jgi:hypothetical protein